MSHVGSQRVREISVRWARAKDPITYGLVAVGLMGVVTLASWVPALRASGINPGIALRAE